MAGRRPILEHEKKKRMVLYVTDAERLVIDRYVAGLRGHASVPKWTAPIASNVEPRFKETKKKRERFSEIARPYDEDPETEEDAE